MVIFDPNELPFWEKARGCGPISEWKAGFDKSLDAQQDHKLRLLKPKRCSRCIDCVMGDGHEGLHEEADGTVIEFDDVDAPALIKRRETKVTRKSAAIYAVPGLKASGVVYRARRAAGLCSQCEEPSPKFARCEKCRERYNQRPARQMRRKS